ncbi:hypothetical protein DVB69_06310 [Sporosarcina sp. BI001-red]|uniref:polysaccharide biosynthesis tyrosine autokinase n=1 Tax=Sporosarcina sp. BI001-red TaxID=2282866 RepID=UPI000E22A689|nr:polysaccharide biosynthesis tyrosine autokinase [Sporosarcina sp. BI001-red]REB08736.1 hypothetical protein DVB69_06310 [Sporosarcina sp. BI001-red]
MSNELNLHDLFMIFKKRWKIIASITAFVSLAALLISYKAPSTYEARMDLLVNYTIKNNSESTALQSSDIELSLQLIEMYKQILKSDRMQGSVISRLDEAYSKSKLRDNISIETDGNSQIFTIVAKENSAEKAALLVNTYATTFQKEIKTLLNLDNITILDEIPLVSDVKEMKTSPLLISSIVFISTLFLTFFILLIREFYFTKLNTAEKIQNFLRIPNLGSVPAGKKGKRSAENYSPSRKEMSSGRKLLPMSQDSVEEFRRIRANVKFQMAQKDMKTIMLTSPDFVEGESLISGNLAIVMAMEGRKTVFVDANLRKPMGRRIFNLPNRSGLTSYIDGEFEIEQIIQETETESLSFISSGPLPENPTEVLSSEKMKILIETLKKQFEIIIIDAPPLAVADAISLSTFVDGCLYIINAEKTNGEMADKNLEYLRKVNAPIIGTILYSGQ